jgi:hypothetical protein
VQHIRRMRGGAQGQLMLGADEHAYVVKFQNNPQHTRVLANEYLASKLALAAGLTAPEVEIIEVSPWLIEHTQELEMDLGRTRERCPQPGKNIGRVARPPCQFRAVQVLHRQTAARIPLAG